MWYYPIFNVKGGAKNGGRSIKKPDTLDSSKTSNRTSFTKGLRHSTIITILTFILCVTMSACSRFGHKQIPLDNLNYNEEIASSSNEQMLLNLVRLRYREVPVFLAVGSVITQYFYVGSLGAGALFGRPVDGAANEIIKVNARMLYAERPTITYSPLAGQEFSQQLLTPIPRELLFSLTQSGWPAEQLLMMCLERVNHLENLPFYPVPSKAHLEKLLKFNRVVQLLIELYKRKSADMHSDNTETPNTHFLVFKQVNDNDTRNLIEELKSILGLDPDQSTFRVTRRLIGRSPDEITIRVRSLIALMGFLSGGVEIPAAHVEEKSAEESTLPVDAEYRSLLFPLRIHSSVERPADAFVAVRHHDHWFYIKNSDHLSKQDFSLLTYLFQMQSPRAQTLGPMITVPTSP